ncbi:RDD family protein [Streptomyces sp. PU-14G]|uniref:RDD family protein n=1 Tax=Streptomyces sp. PU-14G TaxID=2800808 RepID=UPI0034DE8E4F
MLASRLRHWTARIVDFLLWGALTGLLGGVVTGLTEEGNARAVASLCCAGLLWVLLYPSALARFGSTPGKWLLGVRIVRMRTGRNVGFFQALWREFFYLFLTVIPLVGLVNVAACLWDRPYHRCWHDDAAGTLAVDRKAYAERRAAAASAG